ncbi:hypothetical protein FOZ61_000404, partial [Perkinsus olseni]
SPRRHICTSPEVNIDDLNEEEKALYNMRAQRAELARRRKLNIANRTDIEVGSIVLFEEQERLVKEIHYNELQDPIMVTLDDGSRVQVSSITGVRSVGRQPTIVSRPTTIFDEGAAVFFRQKNPDYEEDEGPEWMIHVGKVISYDATGGLYKIHAYVVGGSTHLRWLPEWVRDRSGGGREHLRARRCPTGGSPAIVDIVCDDVLAECDLSSSGAMGPRGKDWLRYMDVTRPDSVDS